MERTFTPRILNIFSDYHYLPTENIAQWVQLFDGSPFAVTTVFLNGDPNERVESAIGGESVIFFNTGPRIGFFQRRNLMKELEALHQLTPFDFVLVHGTLPEKVSYRMGGIDLPKVRVRHELSDLDTGRWGMGLQSVGWPQIAASNVIASDLVKQVPSIDLMNVGTVYPTIDVESFTDGLLDRELARKAIDVGSSDFVFANVAPLEPASNQATLLASFAAIANNHANVKLVIVGRGSLEVELKALVASLGIEKSVLFYSSLPNLNALYRGFDRLVMCGTSDGVPLPVLSAMAAGLPVCVAKNGGLREAVEGVGMLFNVSETDVLTQRMESMLRLDSSHLASTRRAMSERLGALFSMDAVRRQFWQLDFIKPIWKAMEKATRFDDEMAGAVQPNPTFGNNEPNESARDAHDDVNEVAEVVEVSREQQRTNTAENTAEALPETIAETSLDDSSNLSTDSSDSAKNLKPNKQADSSEAVTPS